MPPLPTPEEWARIRQEYEQTRRPIEDICLAYGISANTLRRRVKAWGWTMRRPPISDEGPPAAMLPEETPAAESNSASDLFSEEAPTPTLPRNSGGGNVDAEPSPHIAEPPDARPTSERLQGAAARVMRAIETTSARLTAKPVHLRETDMAARALGSLMRTLRDLNELVGQHPMKAADEDPPPEDMDEFRKELARRIEAVVARHEAEIPAKYEAAWHEFAAEGK